MKIVLLIILAIIAWFVFKAMSKKSTANSDQPAALDNPNSNPDSVLDSATSAVSDGVSDATTAAKGAAEAGSAAVASAATAAVGGKPDHDGPTDESNLMPSSGNMVSDIAEMFKVLNLRASDAPRLGISAEQFESLKSSDAGGLSGDVLETVMQKLKAML